MKMGATRLVTCFTSVHGAVLCEPRWQKTLPFSSEICEVHPVLRNARPEPWLERPGDDPRGKFGVS